MIATSTDIAVGDQPGVCPCIEHPFRLISLKEILMIYADDEFQVGPFVNLAFVLGRLEAPAPVGERDAILFEVILERCIEDMDRFGLRVSARNTKDVVKILKGIHPSTNLHDYITVLRSGLSVELESTLFKSVDASVARMYREPRRDWEEVIERFPDSVSDIEESSKCYALGRYAASVFHSVQVIEHGLLALGEFMELPDPKSGFTAVANALQRVKDTSYQDRTDFERKHYAFFEQVNGSVHAIKDAWRNKVNHAQGKLVVMTADFSPAVAQEIYIATRAFMRRLATDLPEKKRGFLR
jgi:hypothetical protein